MLIAADVFLSLWSVLLYIVMTYHPIQARRMGRRRVPGQQSAKHVVLSHTHTHSAIVLTTNQTHTSSQDRSNTHLCFFS